MTPTRMAFLPWMSSPVMLLILAETSWAVSAMGAKAANNPLNHDRYTDAEAVTAMGAKADNNPLNHDRYTDAEAKAIKLDDFTAPDNNTDLNATTSAHGLLPNTI